MGVCLELKEQISWLEKDKSDLLAQVDQFQKSNESSYEQNENKSKEILDLKDQISQQIIKVDEERNRNEFLSTELDHQKSKIKQLQSENGYLINENNTLLKNLKDNDDYDLKF